MQQIFYKTTILKHLKHEPTSCQELAVEMFSDFMLDSNKHKIFIIKGYAGTGKTTLVSAFVNFLKELTIKSVLLAPTGRAAKVLSTYSNEKALTIHKCIYCKNNDEIEEKFILNYNKNKNTVFFVDEASMINNYVDNNKINFGSNNLLEDLLSYVYNDNNCKLILIGDTAQLPPIGTIVSPALDKNNLMNMGFDVLDVELQTVVRQVANSGILHNATIIREAIMSKNITELPKLQIDNFKDIRIADNSELIEDIESAFAKYSVEETKIITRSNKAAVKYNLGIRNRILWKENEVEVGDLLMVVNNSYIALPENSEIDFIANGDIVEVIKVYVKEEIYGYNYYNLLVRFVDYPLLEIKLKVILDTLLSDKANLGATYYKDLYKLLQEDYAHIENIKKRHGAILLDQYFNALQIKFAYSLTCHKSQGGQWKAVFIDFSFINIENMNDEDRMSFLRWLYTAITRATDMLYLINLPESLLKK